MTGLLALAPVGSLAGLDAEPAAPDAQPPAAATAVEQRPLRIAPLGDSVESEHAGRRCRRDATAELVPLVQAAMSLQPHLPEVAGWQYLSLRSAQLDRPLSSLVGPSLRS